MLGLVFKVKHLNDVVLGRERTNRSVTSSSASVSSSQVEPVGFYYLSVFRPFSVLRHNWTELKASSRLNRSD